MNSDSPRGVGGWLLFLCIILTIITPVRLLGFISSATRLGGQAHELYPAFSNAVQVSGFLGFVLVVMSVRAGVMLWRVKKGAVRAAQQFLVWVIVYATACIGLAYVGNLPAEAQLQVRNAFGVAALQTFVFGAVWHQYLMRSRRVANTYSR